MLAIDTNLIVRYLTGDHPEQAAKAKILIENEDCFVCTTVLLETEWVLRSVYDRTAPEIVMALRSFAGLPRVTLENPRVLAQALNWMELGIDFADALHLASVRGCEALVTFDRRFVQAAHQLGGIKVTAL